MGHGVNHARDNGVGAGVGLHAIAAQATVREALQVYGVGFFR